MLELPLGGEMLQEFDFISETATEQLATRKMNLIYGDERG